MDLHQLEVKVDQNFARINFGNCYYGIFCLALWFISFNFSAILLGIARARLRDFQLCIWLLAPYLQQNRPSQQEEPP
jgi:hypothetical protein